MVLKKAFEHNIIFERLPGDHCSKKAEARWESIVKENQAITWEHMETHGNINGWRWKAKEHNVKNPSHFPGWLFCFRVGGGDSVEIRCYWARWQERDSIMSIRETTKPWKQIINQIKQNTIKTDKYQSSNDAAGMFTMQTTNCKSTSKWQILTIYTKLAE